MCPAPLSRSRVHQHEPCLCLALLYMVKAMATACSGSIRNLDLKGVALLTDNSMVRQGGVLAERPACSKPELEFLSLGVLARSPGSLWAAPVSAFCSSCLGSSRSPPPMPFYPSKWP